MSPAFKGAAAQFQWGIGDSLVTVSGRITDIRVNRTIEKETLMTTQGEVDGVVYLDQQTSGSVDVVMPSTGTSSITLAIRSW